MSKPGVQKYTLIACQEDGEVLMEISNLDWRDVGSQIASWTRQFKMGVNADSGMRWDQNGYVRVHPQFGSN